jgi:peptidyl-prolyl isomerase D
MLLLFKPLQTCQIENCGELKEGEDDGIPAPDDGDIYAGYPADQEGIELTKDRMAVIETIKSIGGTYFQKQDFLNAAKKYEKVSGLQKKIDCSLL